MMIISASITGKKTQSAFCEVEFGHDAKSLVLTTPETANEDEISCKSGCLGVPAAGLFPPFFGHDCLPKLGISSTKTTGTAQKIIAPHAVETFAIFIL